MLSFLVNSLSAPLTDICSLNIFVTYFQRQTATLKSFIHAELQSAMLHTTIHNCLHGFSQ